VREMDKISGPHLGDEERSMANVAKGWVYDKKNRRLMVSNQWTQKYDIVLWDIINNKM
jgi:hypothetical protein